MTTIKIYGALPNDPESESIEFKNVKNGKMEMEINSNDCSDLITFHIGRADAIELIKYFRDQFSIILSNVR